VDTAFEYLSAGIILSMILGVTGVITTGMVSDRMARIEQSSSFKVADKMIDSLLLSPGSPSNWGTSFDNPSSIGLAQENGMKPYQLDRQKVSRLDVASAGYIPPHEVRDLMGLSSNYLISVDIYPMYRITVEATSDETFTINVRNQWNVPVSAVNVTGVFTDIENVNATEISSLLNNDFNYGEIRSALTDVVGNCTLDFTGTGAKATLMVLANQLNVRSLVVWPDSSPDLTQEIQASMGTSTDFSVQIATRSVEIDGMNYYCRLTMWWS
jgi:hypothetical protein